MPEPIMSTLERVRAAHNAPEALAVIADALDRIEAALAEAPTPADTWGEWGPPPETHMLAGAIRGHEYQYPTVTEVPSKARPPVVEATVTEGEDSDHTEISIAPVSASRRLARRSFAASHLDLLAHLPAGEDWIEVYAKGGPVWLYEGNRDLVMEYPLETRAAMVRDIAEDDPKLADEIGRDILKLSGGDVVLGNFAPMANKDVG